VGSDYAQVELKVLAWYAGEQSMIETLRNGGDMHSATAKEVFKLPCTVEEVKKLYKPYRYRSKKINFGLVYGMTEYGLSKDPEMHMTVDEARAFIEQYMQTYPGVRGYEHDMISFAREHGYVETMFNHRRPIPHINHPNKWVRQKAENIAMNTPIQGSAADIITLAMVNIKKDAPRYIKPVIQVHDELMAEVPIEYAAEAAKIIKEIMERPIDGFSEIMPLISEPYVGKIWRHALDVSWDEHGVPYVKPKKERKEATDVTYDDIDYMLPLYKMAGIEVH
jgi:DNA polymerase-1